MYAEFESFLNTLTVRSVTEEDFYSQLQAFGVKAEQWPDCPAKFLFSQFQSIAAKRGENVAAAVLSQKVGGLPPYPSEIDDRFIATHYYSFLAYGRGLSLGRKIMASPIRAEMLVAEFEVSKESSAKVHDHRALIDSLDSDLKAKLKSKEPIVAIHGWRKLSNMIGGFNPGRIHAITAETGVGKTNLALNLAVSASHEEPILYINMEMLMTDLMIRMLKLHHKIEYKDFFQGGERGLDELVSAFSSGELSKYPILMTDGRALSRTQVISTIRTTAQIHGVKKVIVDYDQKIRADDPRKDEWKVLLETIEELEEVAKREKLCVIVLSQADEFGDPKASKRMKQPLWALLHLYKDSDLQQYVLEAKKNRDGARNARLSIQYNPATSYCAEIDYLEEKLKPTKKKVIGGAYPGT